MAVEEQEYVIVPWGTESCETEILTVELPSRDLVVQLEVPTTVIETTRRYSEYHDIPLDRALAERLEINRARLSILTARSVERMDDVHEHLTDARGFLSGVEYVDTSDVEAEIEEIWTTELETG